VVAFVVYDALRSYPLRDRYPGGCGVGWYDDIGDDGVINWCDKKPRAYLLSFKDRAKLSDADRAAWWRTLERYVKRFLELYHVRVREDPERRRDPWWAEDPDLRELWKRLSITASRRSAVTKTGEEPRNA